MATNGGATRSYNLTSMFQPPHERIYAVSSLPRSHQGRSRSQASTALCQRSLVRKQNLQNRDNTKPNLTLGIHLYRVSFFPLTITRAIGIVLCLRHPLLERRSRLPFCRFVSRALAHYAHLF